MACRRCVYYTVPVEGTDPRNPQYERRCINCGRVQDPLVYRRNLNNGKRGRSIERQIAQRWGWVHVGGSAPEDMVSPDGEWAGQVKSGSRFVESVWKELELLNRNIDHDRNTVAVFAETPGPGRKRRVYVALKEETFLALLGELAELREMGVAA